MNETEAPAGAQQSRRFAKRVLDSIRAAGRHTDADVAAVGGPSDSYMTTLRKAAAGEALLPEPRGHTQKRIEQAASWAPGSALKVWAGGDPVPQSRTTDPSWGGATVTTRPASDQELVERLTRLLDERGAVDMFVSDALLAVEQRLAELRMERNRLAHGVPPSVVAPAPEPAVKAGDDIEDIARAVLLRIAAQLDAGEVVTAADFAEAARTGVSHGQQLRRVQDEVGEESQDPGA